jgi:hypothetical protein
VACINDYPTLPHVQLHIANTNFGLGFNEWLELKDPKKAWQKFKDYADFLEKNDPSYPSIGLYTVRMKMLRAFATLCHSYTLKMSLQK